MVSFLKAMVPEMSLYMLLIKSGRFKKKQFQSYLKNKSEKYVTGKEEDVLEKWRAEGLKKLERGKIARSSSQKP